MIVSISNRPNQRLVVKFSTILCWLGQTMGKFSSFPWSTEGFSARNCSRRNRCHSCRHRTFHWKLYLKSKPDTLVLKWLLMATTYVDYFILEKLGHTPKICQLFISYPCDSAPFLWKNLPTHIMFTWVTTTKTGCYSQNTVCVNHVGLTWLTRWPPLEQTHFFIAFQLPRTISSFFELDNSSQPVTILLSLCQTTVNSSQETR